MTALLTTILLAASAHAGPATTYLSSPIDFAELAELAGTLHDICGEDDDAPDLDRDGIPDRCDTDDDGDGIADHRDECPRDADNPRDCETEPEPDPDADPADTMDDSLLDAYREVDLYICILTPTECFALMPLDTPFVILDNQLLIESHAVFNHGNPHPWMEAVPVYEITSR